MVVKKSAPTPEKLLSDFPSDIRRLANDLRALIREAAPDRIEALEVASLPGDVRRQWVLEWEEIRGLGETD